MPSHPPHHPHPRRRESHERHAASASQHPPLRVYPRELGKRPTECGKRKAVDDDIAYAYDTSLEEMMEREIFYDPQLASELVVADQYWKRRAKELAVVDRRHPDRTFCDQCDGSVWQDHEVLGDPPL